MDRAGSVERAILAEVGPAVIPPGEVDPARHLLPILMTFQRDGWGPVVTDQKLPDYEPLLASFHDERVTGDASGFLS